MRSINIKKNSINSSMSKNIAGMVDLSDRQPCWHANLENSNDRFKAKWIIGVQKVGEDKREHSFKASKAGDVTDDKFWQYITSPGFAIELIELFKLGGKPAINNWVKNGCT